MDKFWIKKHTVTHANHCVCALEKGGTSQLIHPAEPTNVHNHQLLACHLELSTVGCWCKHTIQSYTQTHCYLLLLTILLYVIHPFTHPLSQKFYLDRIEFDSCRQGWSPCLFSLLLLLLLLLSSTMNTCFVNVFWINNKYICFSILPFTELFQVLGLFFGVRVFFSCNNTIKRYQTVNLVEENMKTNSYCLVDFPMLMLCMQCQ